MKKLLSTQYSQGSFNFALLVLRVISGILLLPYGYNKLIHFAELRHGFLNFLGMGSTISLSLVIFAELFCPVFIILGLFTRLAVIPPLIGLSVALFKVQHADIFGKGEHTALFLAAFFVILLVGPGRISTDGAMGK